MDPDSMQTAKKCVTFMHSYCADPYSETNDGEKPSSVEPRLVKTDSVCSGQAKIPGPSNSGLETSASGKRSHIRSQTKADFPQEILTFKIPLGNGEHHGEEGICDENSQKENRANNISGNPDFTVEDYGVPKNDVVTTIKQGGKSSPTINNRNGHSEELNLMNHVPKNYSNNMDVKKIPIYDGDFLPGRCESIDMFIRKSEKLNPADSDSKFDVSVPLKFQCDICGKSFKKKNYLQMHLRSHNNLFATNQPVTDYLPIAVTGTGMEKIKNQYLCNICGNSFVRASNLRRHQRLHKKPKVSTKLTSQKNIMLKTVRNRQIQSSKSSQHRCFTCGHMFKKKMDLLLHQITHAPKKEITLKKKMKKNKSPPVTMQQDSGEETDSATEGRMENNLSFMACVSDDASTDTADEFEDNSSPVKYFSCSECDLKFLYQNRYVKHMELHPELEEFECALCHVRFDCTSGLADHFASQCGEKRFRCDVCEQRFSRRATLMQHVQTHTKQVAHKCHLCRRPYNYLKYLKNHYLNHHRVEPHQCATCGKLFHTQSRLESHSLLHNHPHLKNGSQLQTHMFKYEDSDSDHCFADSEEIQKVHLKRAKKTHRKKVSFQNEVQFRGIEIKSEPPFDMDYDDQNNNLYEMPSALPRLHKPRHRRKSLFLAPNQRLADVPDPQEPSEPPLSETSSMSHVETLMSDVNDSLHNGFHPSDDFSSPPAQPAPVNPAERLDWVINKVKISLKIPIHQEPELLEEDPPYYDQEASNTTTATAGFENSLEYPSQYFIGMDPLEAPNYDSVDSPMHLLAQAAEHLDNSRDFNPTPTQAPDLEMPMNPPHENIDEPFPHEQEEYKGEGCLSAIPPEVESSESPEFGVEIQRTQETLSDGDGENSHMEQEDSEEANSFNYDERLESLIQKVKMSVHQAKTFTESSSVY